MRDTTPDAARAQDAVHRRMTGAEKVLLACRMSDEARAITVAGIRARRPDLDENGVRAELMRILYDARRDG